jgi:hypothetical protein
MENNSEPKEADPFVIAIREGMIKKGWNNTILAREAGKLRKGGEYEGKPYTQQAITPLLNHGDGGIVLKTNVAVAVGFKSWHAAYERGKEILRNQGQDADTEREPVDMNLNDLCWKIGGMEKDIINRLESMVKQFESLNLKLDAHISNPSAHQPQDKKNSSGANQK